MTRWLALACSISCETELGRSRTGPCSDRGGGWLSKTKPSASDDTAENDDAGDVGGNGGKGGAIGADGDTTPALGLGCPSCGGGGGHGVLWSCVAYDRPDSRRSNSARKHRSAACTRACSRSSHSSRMIWIWSVSRGRVRRSDVPVYCVSRCVSRGVSCGDVSVGLVDDISIFFCCCLVELADDVCVNRCHLLMNESIYV